MKLRMYGQYCPIARTSEILGDRWTTLIVRELLLGVRGFNELERGLPGISRSVLAVRMRSLEDRGLVTRTPGLAQGRVAYELTSAGEDLNGILDAMAHWGFRWAFGEPRAEELDPWLLLWWLRRCARTEALPEASTVLEFRFRNPSPVTYWLLLEHGDATACLRPPGFDTSVIVDADVPTLYRVLMGQTSLRTAQESGALALQAAPPLIRAFNVDWFAWDFYYSYLGLAPADESAALPHSPAIAAG